MPEIDIHNKPEASLDLIISNVKDKELKDALLVIRQKITGIDQDRNKVDWGIEGTGDDECSLLIGIAIW